MENTEIWASIAGYERYQVSTYGRVWDKEKDREVPQFINDRGYKIVHLTKNRTDKKARVHRLVAEAFIPNPDNLPQVNHKDGKKWERINNHVENLEWCDNKYNNNYGDAHPSQPVKQFSKGWKYLKTWDSARAAAEEMGVNPKIIRCCCRGQINSAYGYKWRYA